MHRPESDPHGIFLIESRQILANIEDQIRGLQTGASDADLLLALARGLHTLKGTCGFLGYENLERLSRDGELMVRAWLATRRAGDGDLTGGLAALVRGLRETVTRIETEGTDSSADIAAVLEMMDGVRGKASLGA